MRRLFGARSRTFTHGAGEAAAEIEPDFSVPPPPKLSLIGFVGPFVEDEQFRRKMNVRRHLHASSMRRYVKDQTIRDDLLPQVEEPSFSEMCP